MQVPSSISHVLLGGVRYGVPTRSCVYQHDVLLTGCCCGRAWGPEQLLRVLCPHGCNNLCIIAFHRFQRTLAFARR